MAEDRTAAAPPPAVVPATRPHRLLAVCAFYNEADYLPGLLENLDGKVDGLIALDDGSEDGSAGLVEGHPLVRRLLRRPPTSPHRFDEKANLRSLVEAVWETDAEWVVAVDADERLEDGFRARAEAAMARADAEGQRAFSVQMRELWNQPDLFRTDGVWGQKRPARLFRNDRSHEFDTQSLHCQWASLSARQNGRFPEADLVVYHLRMIRPESRAARRRRYELLDPEARWQTLGYAYLTDEDGIQLQRVPPDRDYHPRPA